MQQQPLLDGKSLVWLSYDELGVFTAATFKMITERYADQAIKLQLNSASDADELSQMAVRNSAGLVTIVLQQAAQVPAACKALWRIRGQVEQPICVCYIPAEMIDHVGILLEAGAQVVVSQLESWQKSLPRILSRVPLSTLGFHPLTAGLVGRLPWSDVNEA